MPGRRLKTIQATSLRHALELCKDHARERLNLSVDQIADLIGLTNKWMIYKWIESGSIPANMIRPYEHACGCDYITRYLAHSGNRLLIDMPTGRKATHKQLNEISMAMNQTIACLMEFHEGQLDAQDTIMAITEAMENLAWHRHNVEKTAQPEFDFEGDEA